MKKTKKDLSKKQEVKERQITKLLKDKYIAVFFDKNGNYYGKTIIDRAEKTFKYNKNRYVIMLEESKMKIKGLIRDKYYFFYNIENEFPLRLEKTPNTLIEPELLNVTIENKFAQDLARAGSGGLDWLKDNKMIFIGVAVVIAIIYFATGGTIA